VNSLFLRRALIAAIVVVLPALAATQAQNPSAPSSAPARSGEPTPPVPPKTAKPAGAADLKMDGSYSLGVMMGSQLRGLWVGRDAVAAERVLQGLRDGLSGTAKASPADQAKVQALIQKSRETVGKVNQEAAKKFLAENAKQAGVVTTPDGLQYKIITAGSGQSPKPTDTVSVNYRGSLLDGTEFDSSYKRGMPTQFPVNGVIKGWTEALVLMKPGAKWELYIPPELAYDMNPPPGAPIAPGSLLKFEVVLESVKPATAAPGPGAALPKPNISH
jgi:FKBP-type peptidyl-prolyl cis-trans isomerase FklB